MSRPAHDIIVFGATSFVGQILCRTLLRRFGAEGPPRWAMAGRSQDKLEALRESLGKGAAGVPLIVADAADEPALRAMCGQARVIVSTVGPYALYGEPLVKACAESGTDYCDLTGEVQWIRRMIERYEDAAKKSGARIVHCCGFDSIPSDLGVWFLQRESRQRFDAPCTRVKMRVRAMRGGFSGGTVASLMNVVKEVGRDPSLRKELANPYSLCPKGHPNKTRQPQVKGPAFDEDFDAWTAPFVMGAINTRIVQRSNALSGLSYGKTFAYDEAVLTGRGLSGRVKAAGMAGGLGGFMVAAAIKPSRWVLERFVVPKPGEGPTPEQQEKGFFDMRFHGTTEQGRSLRAKVTGDRDPGYGSTAKMLCEAAACLAEDLPRDAAGGFWTPSTLMGEALLSRLQQHAGLEFAVLD
ncbi:saccharopine dehydrogenase family protein [Pseudomarimonas salicorniae]|uniref:Saccharopine dehydrogenase NADP-binding domain-containing protein n=1 Tax=Pseudomarimonas salicorniae TaxID=2933270 RepID=A0ABT0GFU3_9GAMM|nr:saccharopine dehydrogenase NADP-binding domain-containing protein [Lysobacter sp. CAU 1642]MCK7593410.1 saccharopine dehydrogenase NADP-binding domain-containing protein [Lysobacter sp. CAU 1642]